MTASSYRRPKEFAMKRHVSLSVEQLEMRATPAVVAAFLPPGVTHAPPGDNDAPPPVVLRGDVVAFLPPGVTRGIPIEQFMPPPVQVRDGFPVFVPPGFTPPPDNDITGPIEIIS
jgi:hypothetical protein